MRRRRHNRRAGVRADARLLVAEQVHALRHLPYAELSVRAVMRPETEAVRGLNGEPYRRRTAIRRVGDHLLVLVQVHRPGCLGRLRTIGEELLVATRDGRMEREWTLPGDPDDHRPFEGAR